MEKEGQKRQTEHMDGAIDNRLAGGGSPAVVVGIGAGAGALKSLKAILGGLPSGRGVAVALIHHPELTKKNLLKLLKGQTALEVVEAADGMAVLADRIHVIPPDKFLNIAQDRLTFTAPVHCDGLLMPIDHFFCSLADDRRNRCCGILLSGGGGDGTLGLSEIGPRTAGRSSRTRRTPSSPICRKTPSTRAWRAWFSRCRSHRRGRRRIRRTGDRSGPERQGDLAGGRCRPAGRPGYPARQGRSRFSLLQTQHPPAADPPADDAGKIAAIDDYARRLSDHPDEVALLQKDLLIGITEFFRQPQAWETLENRVVAQLVESAREGVEIRVWVPGCASGGGYRLAMLLTEAGGEARQEGGVSDLRHRCRSHLAGNGPHRL